MEPAELGAPVTIIHYVKAEPQYLADGGLGTQYQTLDQTMDIPNSILTFSGEFQIQDSSIDIVEGKNSFTMSVMPQILDSVQNNTGQFRSGDNKNIANSTKQTDQWSSQVPPISVSDSNFAAVQFASYVAPLQALTPFKPKGSLGTNITNNLFYYTVNSSYGLQGSDCTFNGGYGLSPVMAAAAAAQQPPAANATYFNSLCQDAKGTKMWYMNIPSRNIVANNVALGWTPWTSSWLPSRIQLEYFNWMTLVKPDESFGNFFTLSDPGFGFTVGSWGTVNFQTGNTLTPGSSYGAINPCPKREEKWVPYFHYYSLKNMGNNPLFMSSFVRNTNLYNTIATPMKLNTVTLKHNPTTWSFEMTLAPSGQVTVGAFTPVISNLHTPQLMFTEGALIKYGPEAESGGTPPGDICKPSDYFNSAMSRLHDKSCPIPSSYFMAYVNTNLDLPVDRMLSNFAVQGWWGNNMQMGAPEPSVLTGVGWPNRSTWLAGTVNCLFGAGNLTIGCAGVSGQNLSNLNIGGAVPGLLCQYNGTSSSGSIPMVQYAPLSSGIPLFWAPNPNGFLNGAQNNNWLCARGDGYWAGMQMHAMPHTYFFCARTGAQGCFWSDWETITPPNPTQGYQNCFNICSYLRNYPWFITNSNLGSSISDGSGNPYLQDPNAISALWVTGQWGTGPLIGRDYTQDSTTSPGCGIPGWGASGSVSGSSGLGGSNYLGVLGDAVGTVNMFVPPPHWGCYEDLWVPSLEANPYVSSNTSLIGGLYSTQEQQEDFTFIHVPNDILFDFAATNIVPVPLCYGQGFFNTYCGAAGSIGHHFKLPGDLPCPPEAPYDVSNMGANWDVDWQDSYLNQCVFIANRRLMDKGTADKPYLFPINNSVDSAMNSFFTDPIEPYVPRIGHFLVPVVNQNSSLISPGWPTPPHTIYYNTPSPKVKKNNRRDNYSNFLVCSNQGTIPLSMMDLAHGAQAAYGTCCWPKNHVAMPGNISMFYNFPPFTDNLSVPDNVLEYANVPSELSYQYLPYAANSCCSTNTQTNPNSSTPFLFYGLETQYICQFLTNDTAGHEDPPQAPAVPPTYDGQRYGFQCYGTASEPVAPSSYANSPSFSHSFLQPFPEGHAQCGRQLPTYHMATIMERSTNPNSQQTFDQPLVWTWKFVIPPGHYTTTQLLIELNQQLATPDAEGNFPFLRYVDFTTGKYICTACDYVDEYDQPWLGEDNISRYPNKAEEAKYSRGNRFGPPCEAGDEGRVCKIFAGPPLKKLCGSNSMQFLVNPEGYLVLTNTASQVTLGGTSNPLPVGSSLVAGAPSIFRTLNSYQRVGSDPYQMGECYQKINGQQLTLDQAFYNNTTALGPIDYQLILQPCPYLAAPNNIIGCGVWPACTQYTAGLGPNQSFGLNLAPLNTPTLNQLSSSEVTLYNYSSQWMIGQNGSLDNPFNASGNTIVVPGLPDTTYSWPSNPAAAFQNNITYQYFEQAANSAYVGSVFNVFSHTTIPGETQVMVLSLADTNNPNEVAFWTSLGVEPTQLQVFKPEYAYVELKEGLVYDQHTETYLFSQDAFVISNQSPHLFVNYADINIATIPDTTIDITSETDVQKYLDALPLYHHSLASHDLESIQQLTFQPFYAGADGITPAVNFPAADFAPLGFNFQSTIFQKKNAADFTCNNPMFLTAPSSFEGSTLAGTTGTGVTPSFGPFTSGNFPLSFLTDRLDGTTTLPDNMFKLMAYKKGGQGNIACSAILPAITRFLPIQMGELAYANALYANANAALLKILWAGSYLPMTSVFGNNPYNQHTHVAMPVSRTMNGGQFQLSVDPTLPYFSQINSSSPVDIWESLYYKRFHTYHAPVVNPNTQAFYGVDEALAVWGMDENVPNDGLYYPDPLRNMSVNTDGWGAPYSAPTTDALNISDWLTSNYTAQLNVIAGSGYTTFAPAEPWGFQCHETRDDASLAGISDQLFHLDLKCTADPRDAQIFERGPKDPSAQLINIWCGSHLGYCGINSVEHGITYPSNYGSVVNGLNETVFVQLLDNDPCSVTHSIGNMSFLLQHLAQVFSAVPEYNNATGELIPGSFQLYKQDITDAQNLFVTLNTIFNQSVQLNLNTIPTFNPANFEQMTHAAYIANGQVGINLNTSPLTLQWCNDLVSFANLLDWANAPETGTYYQNCHELAMANMTSANQQLSGTNPANNNPQLVLDYLSIATTGQPGLIQAPVAGRVHCDLISPLRVNVSPNSYYQGLCAQPTLPEMTARNAGSDFSATLDVFQNNRHCRIAKFLINQPVFLTTVNLGPVFALEQQLPLTQNISLSTERGRTPLQTYNYFTNAAGLSLFDASDPYQITSWTNGVLVGTGLIEAEPLVAGGFFLLNFQGVRFSANTFTNINGETTHNIPMSIQSNLQANVYTFNSSMPFIIPQQVFDQFNYTYLDTSGKPIKSVISSRLFCTFAPTNAPTPTQLAFLNSQTLEAIHGQGAGQTVTAPSGGTLGNITNALPTNPSLTSTAKRLKTDLNAAPFPGYPTPAFNPYNPTAPAFPAIKREPPSNFRPQ